MEENFTFRLKNKRVCNEVIPFLFKTILNWSIEKDYTKDGVQSYLEFIEQSPSLLAKYQKIKWYSDEKNKLRSNKNCNTLDSTLLNKLLLLVCPEAKSNTRLKNLLSKAMCHGSNEGAVSPTLLDDIKRLTPDLLTLAGSLLKRLDQDIKAKVADALLMVSDIDKDLLIDGKSTTAAITGLLATTGVQEIKDTWSKCTHVKLPFSRNEVDISDVFIKTNFIEKKSAENPPGNVSYDDLYNNLCSSGNSCRIVIVEGDAGAGKTTLVMKIAKTFPRLLLYIQCRDDQIATVPDLVRQNLPMTTKDLDMTVAMKALRRTSVLIIIDGYDEVNDTSRSLVAELLNHFGTNYSAKFLISSRPNGRGKIMREVKERLLHYEALVIKQLSSEEQIDLVSMYAEKIAVNSDEMKKTFMEKRNICSEMCHPVYIVLFCELFREMPNKVKEISSGMNLMELFMVHCQKKIEERIHSTNANLHARELFCCACDVSLKLLGQSKFNIDTITQMKLSNNFKTILGNTVSYESVMSFLFSTKSNYCTEESVSYQFFHASQQEFMASQSLLRKCKNSSVVSAEDVLEQMGLTPEKIKMEDLLRFFNMLKFTILALLRDDNNTEQDRLFPPLAQLAKRAGVEFSSWADILRNFPGNERVEREAAKCDEWYITGSSVTAAAARMLNYHHPSVLLVDIPASKDTPRELPALIEAVTLTSYSGRLDVHLHRSHDSLLPCDEVLEPLRNARCRMTEFTGCVSGAAAWDAFAAVWDGGEHMGRITVSLYEPQTHPLTRLQAKYFSVTVRHCIVDNPALRRPLPCNTDRSVRLTVLDVPASGGAAVAGLLTCLAPTEGYSKVRLTRCLLSSAQLHALTKKLKSAIRLSTTGQRGVWWWTKTRYSDGRCPQCGSSAHGGGGRCIEIRADFRLKQF